MSGPERPIRLQEGRDYYCGTCTGHRVIYCPDCVIGCEACEHTGHVRCPECQGGTIPVPPPRG